MGSSSSFRDGTSPGWFVGVGACRSFAGWHAVYRREPRRRRAHGVPLPRGRPQPLRREIEQEIFNAKKELFELRKQVKTRQPVKPHVFTHTKRRIGQLQTLLSQRAA